MKKHPFNHLTLSKFMLFALMSLMTISCKKDEDQISDIDNPITPPSEKYLHKIERYTNQDMNTASTIITFEYNAAKKISREINTRYTSNNVLTSTYEYEYSDGKIFKVYYSEASSFYKTTDTYEYNGDRIIGRNIEYNNGNPEAYKSITYNEDGKFYEVRDGLNTDYYYMTEDGDISIRALQSINSTNYEYDKNAKGEFYAFKDDKNTAHIFALMGKTYTVRPIVKITNGNIVSEFEHKYDNDGYLIESVSTSGAYSKTIYTYY